MGVKNTKESENIGKHAKAKKSENLKKKKSCYVISKSDDAAELSKLTIRLNITRKSSKSNLYLLKTHYTNGSIYEFPSKAQKLREIVYFVNHMNQRRDAVCEDSPKKIRDRLNDYVRNQVIEGIIS